MPPRLGALLISCSTGSILTSDSSRLAALLAAVLMDYQHTGRSNSFHITLQDDLARQFNDQHVLENASLAMGLSLLDTPRLDFMQSSKLKEDGRKKVAGLPA